MGLAIKRKGRAVGDVFRQLPAGRVLPSPHSVRPPPAILGPVAYQSAFRPPKAAHSDPGRRSPVLPPPAAPSRRILRSVFRGTAWTTRGALSACSLFATRRARWRPPQARPLRVISLSHASAASPCGACPRRAPHRDSMQTDAARQQRARTRKISAGDSRGIMHRRTHPPSRPSPIRPPCRHRTPRGGPVAPAVIRHRTPRSRPPPGQTGTV
ncbi:uncharacterized protein C8Q71DRAFT_345949 [Rhodofomes roseus]|uniref:Uncharacterized protein n=1 Tax=Rhodofomes roseus TaxID=34475 RepID=A0ABQ8KSN2_9APHY|nr:uncharacterized protein C8Q71DRAFT_345949 [Rhodofomes roseus]KAH9841727.1 hypothetical protein C8Q71DRAFT_345949 [Rhodofomes roseus]